MSNADSSQSPAVSAALAEATASAAAGVAAAEVGYQLTQESLKESGAPAVIPLLLVEFAAIAAGFTAYAETTAKWQVAKLAAEVDAEAGVQHWESPS